MNKEEAKALCMEISTANAHTWKLWYQAEEENLKKQMGEIYEKSQHFSVVCETEFEEGAYENLLTYRDQAVALRTKAEKIFEEHHST